jgi:hypothetical protein
MTRWQIFAMRTLIALLLAYAGHPYTGIAVASIAVPTEGRR